MSYTKVPDLFSHTLISHFIVINLSFGLYVSLFLSIVLLQSVLLLHDCSFGLGNDVLDEVLMFTLQLTVVFAFY